MKTAFDETFLEQFATRKVVAAEACSELGAHSIPVRRLKWFERWLGSLRRWIVPQFRD
jgi:hypothetical protein